VNVEGTLNVLLAARDEGIRRVVAASSSSVYGDGGSFPRVETQAPNPISPYAVAKLAAERFCVSFTRVYGIETVALRYFNVFGPRQDPGSEYSAVVPRFITSLLDGRPPTVYGDGEQSRDFTFIDNVVDVNLLAATVPGISGSRYNVACGGRSSLNALLDTMRAVIGCGVHAEYREARSGEVRHSEADISAARHELGYEPRVGLEEGIRRTVEHYRTAALRG
jgi:UDP-glucose 4-epimerase